MITTTHYRASDYRTMPWKNGAGTTTELARDLEGEHYGWRLSIADVTDDGEFSTFPGRQRIISVVEGAGMRLTTDGAHSGRLLPYENHTFDGNARTTCELINGPVRDFNLIYRPDTYDAQAAWLALPDSRTFQTAAETVLVYNHSPGAMVRLSHQGAADREFPLSSGELLRVGGLDAAAEISVSAVVEGHCAVLELHRAHASY